MILLLRYTVIRRKSYKRGNRDHNDARPHRSLHRPEQINRDNGKQEPLTRVNGRSSSVIRSSRDEV